MFLPFHPSPIREELAVAYGFISHRSDEEAADEGAHQGPDQAHPVGEPVVGAPQGVVRAVEVVHAVLAALDEPLLGLSDMIGVARHTHTTPKPRSEKAAQTRARMYTCRVSQHVSE